MAAKWYIDTNGGEVYYPDETHATTIGETETPVADTKQWALSIVSDIGINNLTSEQLIWLLALTMDQIVIGPPPSMQ